MTERRVGFSTAVVHSPEGFEPPGIVKPVVTPVFQSTTFENEVGTTRGLRYTRYGNNPNQIELGRVLATLENAEKAAFFASGMGATALAHLATVGPGDHILSSKWIYGGTKALFETEFDRLGISVTFADPTRPGQWSQRIRRNTKAFFVETPTNPLTRVIDIAPLARLARGVGATLIVDSTFASAR